MFRKKGDISSVYCAACLLCFAAVLGEEALTQTAAPVETKPANESLKQVPVLVVEMPAPKLDAERATILGETKNVTKLLDPSMPLSTTLESMAENKTAVQKPQNESIHEALVKRSRATGAGYAAMNQHKPDVAPEHPGNTSVCADRVVVHGARDLEPDCMGVFKKSDIVPGKNHSFRTIYINQRGKHLYFWAPAGNWIIETDGAYESPYGVMFSHTDTMCPEDAGKQNKWKIWEEDGWTDSRNITAKPAGEGFGGDFNADENEEELDAEPKLDAGEIEVVHNVEVPVVNSDSEPSSGSLMRLPLFAALISFAGVLAYSFLFLCKISKPRRDPKGKASHHTNKEFDSKDLESALDGMSTKSLGSEAVPFPVVRKKVHAKDEKACGKVWDNDMKSDAGWGDNAWDKDGWDDLETVA